MKRRILAGIMLACVFMSGCDSKIKIEKPLDVSNNLDSYVNAVQAEKFDITGKAVLNEGDYVVYPYEGQTCLIADTEIGQEFTGRDFIHVNESVEVNITNGYLLPLDKAPASSGEIFTDGVYLVGFDVLPMVNKVGTSDMVVVSESIPTLFEKTSKTTHAKYEEFEAKDGMLVKFSDTYLASRPSWDVQARTSSFWDSYVNTAIDAGRSKDNDELGRALGLLMLYSTKLEAELIDGTIVKLSNDNGVVEFTYNNHTYTIPKATVYTVISDPKLINATEGTTLGTQSYREYLLSGDDKLGASVSNNNSLLFYILGDYYSLDTLKILEKIGGDGDTKDSVECIKPDSGKTEPESVEYSELKDGYIVFDDSTLSINKVSESTVNMYDALNKKLDDNTSATVAKGATLSTEKCTPGIYKIEDGSLLVDDKDSAGISVVIEDGTASSSLALEEPYVLIYEGGTVYTATEDTTIVGATFDDAFEYYSGVLDGTIHTEEDTKESEDTYSKTYTIEAGVIEIGSTMSANLYTFSEPTDVTIYPYATGIPHRYQKCAQMILQRGDRFEVADTCVLKAQVTEAMDNQEKEAVAREEGYIVKIYTIKKSFVAGVDMPVLEYTVDSDVTVTSGENTYKKGDKFTPKIGDTVSVDGECEFSVFEPIGVTVDGTRYDIFGEGVEVGDSLPAGKYKVVGGSFSLNGETKEINSEVELRAGDVTGEGWFVLENIETESVTDTEG